MVKTQFQEFSINCLKSKIQNIKFSSYTKVKISGFIFLTEGYFGGEYLQFS